MNYFQEYETRHKFLKKGSLWVWNNTPQNSILVITKIVNDRVFYRYKNPISIALVGEFEKEISQFRSNASPLGPIM